MSVAARRPFEVHLDPRRMPCISGWHQAPATTDPADSALHLVLFSSRRAPGKLKHLAGSESGMGVFINDVPPERAASMLRDARL